MNPQERLSVANEKVRVVVNLPGTHPFLTLQVSEGKDSWFTTAVSGAMIKMHSYRGATFPRVCLPLGEVDIEPEVYAEDGALRFLSEGEGYRVRSVIQPQDGDPIFHVVHELEAVKPIELRRLFDTFDFVAAPSREHAESLDYAFVPHLRPRKGMVIGDHVFRSPALIFRREDLLLALVPDLELLSESYRTQGMRAFLDMVATGGENHSPRFAFGLGRYRVKGHVYFQNDFFHGYRLEAGTRVKMGYYLFICKGGYREGDVVSYIWDRFGRPMLEKPEPQVVSLDEYAGAALSRIFKKDDLFHSFQHEGQHCGGSVAIYMVRRRGVKLMSKRKAQRFLKFQNLFFHLMQWGLHWVCRYPWGTKFLEKWILSLGPKTLPQILFQSWYNNLRSAYGAYWYGLKWGDEKLKDSALRVKNLALVAPDEGGAFPAVCYFYKDGIEWCKGTKAFEHVDYYHTADCSTTAYHLLQWYRDLEMDPRILGRCTHYGEFLLRIQLPSGAIPAWVLPKDQEAEEFVALPELKESASTACSSMFLVLLYQVTGKKDYLEAAKRAAEFLEKEVIPPQKWFDYETFYSCSRRNPDTFNRYTATYRQNTMSMYWAAETLRLLFEATGEEKYLSLGRAVLDHLCLYQQVWDPPFLSINAFGGFGVMNTDGDWNDARQGIIAPVLMDYYRATGERQYMERGIAALRASFTTMYLEDNRAVAPGNLGGIPDHETGSIAENYGHFGYDHRTPGFLESDWGPGSAGFAAAYADMHYGGVYIDLDRGHAFGINGCRVKELKVEKDSVEIEVERQLSKPFPLRCRLVTSKAGKWSVVINGVSFGQKNPKEMADGLVIE